MAARKRLGDLLVEAGRITPSQLELALEHRRQKGGRIASAILDLGFAHETELLTMLALQLGVPSLDLSRSIVSLEPLSLVPKSVAIENGILPVQITEGQIALAMASPDDEKVQGEVQFVTGLAVKPMVVLDGVLKNAIETAYRLREMKPMPRFWRGDLVTLNLGAEPEGGFLWVISENLPDPDFEITLDEDPGPLEVSDDDVVPIGDEAPSKSLVLIVDDDLSILSMLQTAMQKQGYEVLTANRGDLALEIIRARKPHVVLLDAMLPGVHGFEVCQKIKSSEHYRASRVIMISALYKGWRIANDICSVYGADAFFEKPFHMRPLLSKVKELVAGRHAAEAEEIDSGEAFDAYDRGISNYREKKYLESEEALREACRLSPFSARAHYALANVLVMRQHIFEAMHEYEEAIALREDLFTPLRNLAILYQRQGFRKKAAEMWERALGCAPDEETKASVRDQLLKLI